MTRSASIPTTTPMHARMRDAGIRLIRIANNRYEIVCRHHGCVASDLTLLEAALWVSNAVEYDERSSQQMADQLLAVWQAARAAGIPADKRLEDRASARDPAFELLQ
jgi:hypothetical protein